MDSLTEIDLCQDDFARFCGHCSILDSADVTGGTWIPFRLWPCQAEAAAAMQTARLLAVLKSRQMGLSWLAVAFTLWHLLLHPVATVLLFSRRDDEAVDLLRNRLRGMHARLPAWLRAGEGLVANDHEWHLASGSRAMAFPTTAGDSYTATLAVVDEADLCPDLNRLLRAVKPTIDGGGRLLLISRADKSRPESAFKRVYAAGKTREGPWRSLFLPWHAHPARNPAWYAEQRADVLARTGALDDLHEQYPAVDAEALSPRTLDKRLAPVWLQACYAPAAPLAPLPPDAPSLPALEVYAAPRPGGRYVVGGDPAEGNPQSDPSALEVLDADTGEQVAALAGRLEPAVFAAALDAVGRWYNWAPILAERNNHGHAVLLWLREHSGCKRLLGPDGKEGWQTSALSKARLYDTLADQLRAGEVQLHALATYLELASVEGSTLRAPEGQHDDRAVAFALAAAGRRQALLAFEAPVAGGARGTLVGQLPAGVFRK
jgi:hypothetical protein